MTSDVVTACPFLSYSGLLQLLGACLVSSALSLKSEPHLLGLLQEG